MLSLCKELENEISYQGKKYKVNLAFDNVLRWYEMIDDDKLSDPEKILLAFQMFVPTAKTDDVNFVMETVEKLSKYIAKQPYGDTADDEQGLDSNSDPVKYYSYKQDAGAIYASFMQDYRIDLINEQGKMHWDKFKALLDGLSEQTQFKQIVRIRMADTAGLKGKELNNLISLQSYYALDEYKSVGMQNAGLNDLFNALAEKAKQ